MTKNQLQYHANMEAARHNRAMESETNRSNLAVEAETFRSNWAKEREAHRSNRENERLKGVDHILKGEEISNTNAHYQRQDSETYRSNLEKERENYRHNVASEEGVKYTADRRLEGKYVSTLGNLATLFANNMSPASRVTVTGFTG